MAVSVDVIGQRRFMKGMVSKEVLAIQQKAVHNLAGGLEAAKRKQDTQKDTELQIELGSKGLVEQDRYLLEINLEDLENFSGGRPVLLASGNSNGKGGQGVEGK